jgi:hypothetical protein
MLQKEVVEKIKTHISLFSSIFFFENCAVHEIMWNNTVGPGRSHDNMAHAHCMLDT